MSAQKGKPVILCGRSPAIGGPVTEYLKPEYDVVRFVSTDDDGKTDIPLLLTGQTPPTTGSAIGSGDYSKVPVAVILGGGFNDDSVSLFQAAVQKASDARKVPWCRADTNKTVGAGLTTVNKVDPDAVAKRVKDLLDRLEGEGKLNGGDNGVYYY